MITFLRKLLFSNWQRKLLALILAMIIWLVVHHYMSLSATVHNVSVRVKNIPHGKAIEGAQSDGTLREKITLKVTGNKELVSGLSGQDFEVVIDAKNTLGPWKAEIDKTHLLFLDRKTDLRRIYQINSPSLFLKTVPMITEKVPIFVAKPTGNPPRGYDFVDVLPYNLYLDVTGPESVVKNLKKSGVELALNLDLISRDDLDALYEQEDRRGNEVSYSVPDALKAIEIPSLSKYPFCLNNEQAKYLRINFVKKELLQIPHHIPISCFFSHRLANEDSANPYSLRVNNFIGKRNGIYTIKERLFVKGVSTLFTEIIKDMIQIVISITPDGKTLGWNVQIMNPHQLEDRYVKAKQQSIQKRGPFHKDIHSQEEYLRNRFRKYMNELRLFTANNEKLALRVYLEGREIVIERNQDL
ncbi:MAG: hypothetical protein AAGF04_04665 [Chlamydiota bacterium]